MDSNNKAVDGSAAEVAESKTADSAQSETGNCVSPSCTDGTYGCSHYQRKCSLVV